MAETQEARWYVVHTYSGYENKVASDLATMVESRGMQELIQEIRIPTETVTEIKEDKKKEIEQYNPNFRIAKKQIDEKIQ